MTQQKTRTKRAAASQSQIPDTDPRQRVVIENVQPEIDQGKYAAKAVIGDRFTVQADIFADGHDLLGAMLRYRHESEKSWTEERMALVNNDRWRAKMTPDRLGTYFFTVSGWVDQFETWRHQLSRRVAAEQDASTDLLIGGPLVEAAAGRAKSGDAKRLKAFASQLIDTSVATDDRTETALGPDLRALMLKYPGRSNETTYGRELRITVDPELARFSAWYELFPRSTSPDPNRHGTFKDCEAVLPYVADMGFNILYLPPIHPIGRSHRKGKNNAVAAEPADVGSPWAIGSDEGGHRDIHSELGTPEEFRSFVKTARGHGLEVALDIAFQCSPDHPYVREHPEWFKKRPDGTIQYAENPPKKYQDIVPIDFDSEHREEIIEELIDVVRHWVNQGVRVFRVDNPHTKPFALWERLIPTLKSEQPDLIFLSEAFTRPKVMYRLAKLGFTHSYTYFAWRNMKWELQQYLTEVTRPPVSHFFRPNLWPNTPDILTEYLQTGGRPAFMVRFVLAATLAASYGIYGPAFELLEHEPREEGSEEYLDSEKYQLRNWDLDRADSLKDFIAAVNGVRKEHSALQRNSGLVFHETDNPEIICYSKSAPDSDDTIMVVANLDPHHTQSAWTSLDIEALKIEPDEGFQVHDLLTDTRYLWHGSRNYVELSPHSSPAHIFAVRKYVRTEQDFDYYA